LRVFKAERNKEEIESALGMFNYLRKKGFPCPKVIKNNEGKLLLSVSESHLKTALFSFEEGTALGERANSLQVIDAARTLAKFHKRAMAFLQLAKPPSTSIYSNCNDFEWSRKFVYQPKKSSSDERERKAVEELEKISLYLERKLGKTRTTHFKQGVIHNDFNLTNVKFSGNGVSTVLDFQCELGFLAEDLGIALSWWGFRNRKFDSNQFELFLRSYLRENKIPEKDLQLTPFFLEKRLLLYCNLFLHRSFSKKRNYWDFRYYFNKLTEAISNENIILETVEEISCGNNLGKAVAAGAIIVRKTKAETGVEVLLGFEHGRHSLPKGHVDEGESLKEAARREVLEETGVKELTQLKELGSFTRISGKGHEEKRIHFFLAKAVSKNKVGKWVSLNKAIDYSTYFPEEKKFLESKRREIHHFANST
jgi:Ser/Thr protein kinase RdoA (MazF antagonist)/ADP-ribose pyrophosphatase YjhB (NUDIX family)